MKILIVSHPDDEILWFNPEDYDKIIVVFSGREDRPSFKALREKAIENHPLKVVCWGLTESNFWRDNTKYAEHQRNYEEICRRVKDLCAKNPLLEIDTHNANGEYGHADHILVHNAVMDSANCKVNGKNAEMYRKIKNLYNKYEVWTWH